jgi:hypothetical protein
MKELSNLIEIIYKKIISNIKNNVDLSDILLQYSEFIYFVKEFIKSDLYNLSQILFYNFKMERFNLLKDIICNELRNINFSKNNLSRV